MARMLGAMRPSWCPYCRGPAGVDCSDAGLSTRAHKAIERREVRREVVEAVAERARGPV